MNERAPGSAAEQQPSSEFDVRRLSPELSHRILGNKFGPDKDSKRPLEDSPQVSAEVDQAIFNGSIKERTNHWNQEGKPKTYGEQMLQWLLGQDGHGGMAAWVGVQRGENGDPIVKEVLKAMNLSESEPGKLQDFLASLQNDKNIKDLLGRVNQDLGDHHITLDNLTDPGQVNQLIALKLYADYLNPESTNLIWDGDEGYVDLTARFEEIVDAAESKEQAVQSLQGTMQLLNVLGERASKAFAARIKAAIDAKFDGQAVVGAVNEIPAGDQEVYEFIEAHHPRGGRPTDWDEEMRKMHKRVDDRRSGSGDQIPPGEFDDREGGSSREIHDSPTLERGFAQLKNVPTNPPVPDTPAPTTGNDGNPVSEGEGSDGKQGDPGEGDNGAGGAGNSGSPEQQSDEVEATAQGAPAGNDGEGGTNTNGTFAAAQPPEQDTTRTSGGSDVSAAGGPTQTPAPTAQAAPAATPSATPEGSGATTAVGIVPPEKDDAATTVVSVTRAPSRTDDDETLIQPRVEATSGEQPGDDSGAMADESTVHTAAAPSDEEEDSAEKTTAPMGAAGETHNENPATLPHPSAVTPGQGADTQPTVPGAPSAPISSDGALGDRSGRTP